MTLKTVVCGTARVCQEYVLARHAERVAFLNITEEQHGMKNCKLEGDQLLCGMCGILMAVLKISNQIVSS
jgi:deoxycytidylate deaminase